MSDKAFNGRFNGRKMPKRKYGARIPIRDTPQPQQMTDDLRTRIAKVLHRQYGPSLGAAEGGWDCEPFATQDVYRQDADAVIRELGNLRQEPHRFQCGSDGCSRYRIISDWTTDE